MATKKSRKPVKKIKPLRAKTVSAKQARAVKGGDVNHAELNITKNLDKTTPIFFSK